jgi:hypothetical protein
MQAALADFKVTLSGPELAMLKELLEPPSQPRGKNAPKPVSSQTLRKRKKHIYNLLLKWLEGDESKGT